MQLAKDLRNPIGKIKDCYGQRRISGDTDGGTGEYCLLLKCCNRQCVTQETINLYDTIDKRHRVIILGVCKKCGKRKAQLIYFDIPNGVFRYENIRQKDINIVVAKYKQEPYLSNVITSLRQGSRANMNWKYHRNGNIYDFNEVLIGNAIRKG